MRFIKNHVGSLIAWILIVVISIFMLPNVNQLTREHSTISLPANVQSEVASTIGNHWGHHQNNTYQVVAVFNNQDGAMSKSDQKNVNQTIRYLKRHKSELGIKSMLTPYENSATKKNLISKDKTTELVQLNVSKKKSVSNINKQLTKAVKTDGIRTYITGADILQDDFSGAIQEGIKKTEVISVIFIFIVLVLVFRSPIVPLISLLTVGVSFITAFSIVTNLVKNFNFPFSNFTQVFMVIVLFGIGTDYNILLYDRFKANLGNGMDKFEAAKNAQWNAGKTILMSGSSILIGFSALGLARFSVYKSAAGVAVGVAVLLIVLLTLNMFFMTTMGKTMFWPVKTFTGETESPFWRFLSKHSLAHPIIALVLVLAALSPFYFTYQNKLNYDDTAEIADSTPSKQGFLIVQKHFSKGTAEPATLYIKSNHTLDNEKDLKLIDQLTEQIKHTKGVKTVASVTQPSGSKIKKLYVNSQMKTVNNGVSTARNGLGELSAGSQQMTNGLNQLNSGLGEGQSYLTGLQKSAAAETFYIPKSVLHSKTFKPAIDNYMSSNRKITKITIVFDTNPSDEKATKDAENISNMARKSLKGTALSNATVAMGGQSSRINDIKNTASGDFVRTAAIMLIGIGIALMLITHSLLQPVYILGSLLLAYISSLSINHWLVGIFMHRSMLAWNTPFFSFIMLIALGVDYSIFLMTRYREIDENKYLPGERIYYACAIIGTVVISAAIILSGTFAALIPSGIPTLIEVAMTVIVGLIILVIILPIVMTSTIYLSYPIRNHVKDNQNKRKD